MKGLCIRELFCLKSESQTSEDRVRQFFSATFDARVMQVNMAPRPLCESLGCECQRVRRLSKLEALESVRGFSL